MGFPEFLYKIVPNKLLLKNQLKHINFYGGVRSIREEGKLPNIARTFPDFINKITELGTPTIVEAEVNITRCSPDEEKKLGYKIKQNMGFFRHTILFHAIVNEKIISFHQDLGYNGGLNNAPSDPYNDPPTLTTYYTTALELFDIGKRFPKTNLHLLSSNSEFKLNKEKFENIFTTAVGYGIKPWDTSDHIPASLLS